MSTSPGHAGRDNEDFVGAVAGAVVLLDGAGIPGSESLCRHGTAWYAQRLGAALLARLAGDGLDLAEVLADVIDEVASAHRTTCDLRHTSSPQATVAMVRVGQEHLEVLVLGDSFALLDGATGVDVVTDPREVTVRGECLSLLDGVPPGTPEHDRAFQDVRAAFRARRNVPGGFWVAKDNPAVANEAVRVSRPLAEVTGVGLVTNGAGRIVDPYALASWPEVARLLDGAGPAELARRVREAEAEQGLDSDDATAAWLRLGPDLVNPASGHR